MIDITEHTPEDYSESDSDFIPTIPFKIPKPTKRIRKKAQPRRHHKSKKGLLFLYRPSAPHNTTQYILQKKVYNKFDVQELTGSMLHLISFK